MTTQAKRYRTQWAAQFFAAAELTRRGHLVSLTFGNAPVADLLVQSPEGRHFSVDVKGQSAKSFWLVQRRSADANHYFILVYVPRNSETPRYFVLSSAEMAQRREEYKKNAERRGKYRDDLGGMNWATAFRYEDGWANLPAGRPMKHTPIA